MKRKKSRLLFFVLILFSCGSQYSNEKSKNDHNKSNLIEKYRKEKLQNFLDKKDVSELSKSNFYEYARIDEGLKIVPLEFAHNVLDLDTSNMTYGGLLVSFLSEEDKFLIGTFHYINSIINRYIFTINNVSDLSCIDKLIVDKEIVISGNYFRISEANFTGDTLNVTYLMPVNIDDVAFNNRLKSNFMASQKYLMSSKGFDRIR